MKPFFIKVSSEGGQSDNYIGYWLVFACDFKSAKTLVVNSYRFLHIRFAWEVIVTEVKFEEMLDKFGNLVNEITYDCYN